MAMAVTSDGGRPTTARKRWATPPTRRMKLAWSTVGVTTAVGDRDATRADGPPGWASAVAISTTSTPAGTTNVLPSRLEARPRPAGLAGRPRTEDAMPRDLAGMDEQNAVGHRELGRHVLGAYDDLAGHWAGPPSPTKHATARAKPAGPWPECAVLGSGCEQCVALGHVHTGRRLSASAARGMGVPGQPHG